MPGKWPAGQLGGAIGRIWFRHHGYSRFIWGSAKGAIASAQITTASLLAQSILIVIDSFSSLEIHPTVQAEVKLREQALRDYNDGFPNL